MHPYFETRTDPSVFLEQIKLLHENGYTGRTLAELRGFVQSGKGCDDKSVVITFDDGYEDFCKTAFPILKMYGFTATVFLPTGYIDSNDSQFNGTSCLSWSQVNELHAHGIDFGSHTVTHPNLRTLGEKQLRWELKHSKETLEDKIGRQIESFSHPYAFPEEDLEYQRRMRAVLEECSYVTGVTTIIGTTKAGDDVLFLKRLPVNTWDDQSLLLAKLEGAYDWLHKPQRAFKLFKHGLTRRFRKNRTNINESVAGALKGSSL